MEKEKESLSELTYKCHSLVLAELGAGPKVFDVASIIPVASCTLSQYCCRIEGNR